MFSLNKNKKSLQFDPNVEQQIEAEINNLEVHVMPDKFLGIKPSKFPAQKFKKAHSKELSTVAKGPAKTSKKIMINILIVIGVGLVMSVAAFFITRTLSDGITEDEDTVIQDTPQDNDDTDDNSDQVDDTDLDDQNIQVLEAPSLSLEEVDLDSVRLSWNDSSDQELGFRLYRNSFDDLSSAGIVSSIGPNITSFRLANLDCDSEYYFWLEVFSETDEATSSQVAVSTDSCEEIEESETIPEDPPVIKDAPDEDGDSLTDKEELLFGTNIELADSDGDSYSDGGEVVNLFDPRFGGGAKLIDSNSVRVFISNEFSYRLLVPVSWPEELILEQADQVRFKASSDEFVEVIIELNSNNFSDARIWYTDQFPSINPSDLTNIDGRNIVGILSPGGLTAFFVNEDYIFTVTYNPGLKNVYNYLTTFRMMVSSFAMFDNPLESL